jgi:ribose 1,5-bisphosphokinase PhnN
MIGRLVYVAGPSGAGKDSLLAWLKKRLAPGASVAFARRTITRAATADGEQHDSIDMAGFMRLRRGRRLRARLGSQRTLLRRAPCRAAAAARTATP